MTYHDNVLLHPRVRAGGITTDSLIVGIFILIHVGSRFLGQSVQVAEAGVFDATRPFASAVAPIWYGASADALRLLEHVFWWAALGGILLFTPYFPQSKHAHLFMAPLNFLTRPRRTSLGEMAKIDFEDESIEQFGAERLEHLPKTMIFDSFACIMCNRCQDVCPAYITGKELSPSAHEINKRYLIRDNMSALAAGAESTMPLNGGTLSESAVWACTACGACIDICPVGNEGNPWLDPDRRFAWAKDMDIPTVDDNPDFDVLYWTGCAVSCHPRAQLTARALVKVLERAGVNYAVLGDSGDLHRRLGPARRQGRSVPGTGPDQRRDAERRLRGQGAADRGHLPPHCFHNIGKEYHQFSGDYEVVHRTAFIEG
ncbi:MAG: (Fe-S)-binding protein [Chloroflexi bacterium]|nr:(Fe-S)-binding protein [Chloroflexota bacterium]